MIATVTPNPAIDLTIATPELILGGSVAVPSAVSRAGGKGVNVARVLAQVGRRATVLGMIGAGDLDFFVRDLESATVAATPVSGPTRTSYAVFERAAGRVTMLNERGVQRSAGDWAALVARIDAVSADAACVTVSGSLPPDPPRGAVAAMIRASRAPVVADLVGGALIEAIDAGAVAVKPNRDELHATVGGSVREGARALLDRGARLVVVSLGTDGMLAVSRSHPAGRTARLDAVLSGNATGAGDAAVAALASSVEDGVDLDHAVDTVLTRAVAWSAAAVLSPVAGALDPDYATFHRRVAVAAA